MNVRWDEIPLDKLTDLYVAARPSDREMIAAAVQRMNVQLAWEAWTLGESREEAWRRVWFHFPLVIQFEIFFHENEVVVTDVAELNRPRES